MESKIKRFLVLLITLLLLASVMGTMALAEETPDQTMPECYRVGDVDGDGVVATADAIYLLKHTFWNDEFPVSHDQNCDFDKDDKVNTQDAIYILKSTFPVVYPEFTLDEIVHDFYDPAWVWEEKDGAWTATVTFKCGCDEGTHTHSADDQDESVVISVETKDPTCVTKGTTTYTAAWGEYTSEKTVVKDALGENGHVMVGEVSCVTGAKCQNCGYEQPALGHKMVKTGSTPATCQSDGSETYECQRCEHTEVISLGLTEAERARLHHYEYTDEVIHDEKTCLYTKVLKCKDCDATKNGESYNIHRYTATLTKEATCSEQGVKTYKCDYCGHSYTEDVPKNETHTWVEGETVDGVTTHRCACGASKTTVAATSEGEVKTEQAGNQIDLGNDTTVELDEDLVDSLVENQGENLSIKITATPIPKEEASEDTAVLSKIPGEVVYDFSLVYSDNTPVPTKEDGTFAGKVTISLPYELQEEDDVDNINVWYIADDGTVQSFKGTYSNGFVSFETDHFSYYTVTRLTNAERCELYDHVWNEVNQAPTCTNQGRYIKSCQRCGKVEKDETLPSLGHDYVATENVTAPTCDKPGITEEKCSRCGDTKKYEIPALGHDYALTEQKEPTHTAAGQKISVCGNCGDQRVEEIPQLAHEWQTEQKAANCTEAGYVRNFCACGAEEMVSQTAPLGHNYATAEWSWAEDYTAATATLICDHANCGHTLELKAVVSKSADSASCTSGGTIRYTGTVSHNNKQFKNEPEVKTDPLGHKPGSELQSNATQHYYVCTKCDAKIGFADHIWGNEQVITAATCVKNGKAAVECTVCGYEGEKVLLATGEHTYVNGVCSGCGNRESDCDHIRTYKTPVDLSAYDICNGAEVLMINCDCGLIEDLYFENVSCNLEYKDNSDTLQDTKEHYTETHTCSDCGLKIVFENWDEVNEEACTGRFVSRKQIFFDDELIVETVYNNPNEEYKHPYHIVEKNIDLSQYGLCQSVWNHYECYCGEIGTYLPVGDSGCNWIVDEENSTATSTRSVCSVCNGVKIREESSVENGCEITVKVTERFYVNDELVYTMEYCHLMTEHNYQIADYELYGSNCKDGIMVTEVCTLCSDSHQYYATDHVGMNPVVTDLSDTGFCATSMTTTTCPCEEKIVVSLFPNNELAHEWNWLSYEESEDGLSYTLTQECANCGYTRVAEATHSEPDGNCRCTQKMVNTYTKGDHTFTGYSYEPYAQLHDIEQTATLLGKYCTDGIRYTETCERCGMVNTWEDHDGSGHRMYVQESYDVAQLDACSAVMNHYECLCGELEHLELAGDGGFCRLNEWIEGGNNYRVQKCTECGILVKTEYEDLEQIDECHVKRHYTYTLTREGMEPVVIEKDLVDGVHTVLCDATLLNPELGCDGGYNVARNCTVCDYSENWIDMYGHETWPVKREKLTNGEFCGELYYTENSCACGEYADSWTGWENGECTYIHTGYSEEYQGDIWACAVCGGQHISSYTEGERNGCEITNYEKHVYLTKDGELVAEVENQYTSHDYEKWLFSYELKGETCNDGYTVIAYCPDCGTTQNWGVKYGCNARCVDKELLFDAEGVCAPVYLKHISCACGMEEDNHISHNCEHSYSFDPNLGDIWTCNNCDLEIVLHGLTDADLEPVEGEPCKKIQNLKYTFRYGENDPVVVETTGRSMYHQILCSFTPASDNPADNICETGYYITNTCANCDYYNAQQWVSTGHNWYNLERIDLTEAPYNMCGGVAVKYGCACGKQAQSYIESSECAWSFVGTDPETGFGIEQCSECGVQKIEGNYSEYDPESCTNRTTWVFRILRNDQILLNMDSVEIREQHDHIGVSYTLHNPDGTCEDGVTWDLECRTCGQTAQVTEYGHVDFASQILELPENTCGGRIVEGGCACGESSFVSHEYKCESLSTNSWSEQIDGVTHWFDEHVCNDCGLTHVTESYEDYIDTCNYYHQITYTYSLNGTELGTFHQKSLASSHDADFTYELMDGSTNCEDGVIRTAVCKNCGWTHSATIYDHETGTIETIGLAQYGAEGDTCLMVNGCVCGEYRYYELSGGPSSCDLDVISTEHWIPGVLDGVGPLFSVTDSHVWIHSYSYDIRCAVTEPQCDFKMRRAEYWLQEGCEAVQYETWEVYDPATGSYITLVEPAPTGYRQQNHPYTVTEKSDYYLDDGTLITSSTERVCPDCGSYYIEQDGVDTSNVQFHRIDAVNTLNNGQDTEWHQIVEYGFEHDGYKYVTLDRSERTQANGSTWWEQRVYYNYNFDGDCTRESIDTNSDGWYSEGFEYCHMGYEWNYETVKEPTCSQFGLQVESESCVVCKKESYRNEYILNPTEHHNMYWDEAKQMYVCPSCGLELFNPASGTITMEDMSDDYGNGTDYVIGYWNQDASKEFMPTLSVILNDAAEGENDQLILDFSEFTYLNTNNGDDITAVTFNKALADQAAADAVAQAGYTGSYSLRFNFVILGGGELDYAITFDPVTTNNA